MAKRYILEGMFLFLYFIHALVVMSLNIAIISMVNYTNLENGNKTTDVVCPNTTFYWQHDINVEKNSNIKNKNERYDWNEYDRNLVLSSSLWLNWLPVLPMSILAQYYGSKIIVGYAEFISCILSSLIPIFASTGATTVAFIRITQGFFMGMVPGAIDTIIGNWIPTHERGHFMATAMIGSVLGFSIGDIIFGFIAQYIHWHYVFHLTSLCGVVWAILWYWLVYDSPEEHPNISAKEKNYIINSLKYSTSPVKISIPWKCILTSFPFLITVLSFSAFFWHLFILITYTPSYMKIIYGMNTTQIGFIHSISQLGAGVASYVSGFSSDFLLKKDWLSTTHCRKIFSFLGGTVASIPLLIMAYTKCNVYLVIACFIFATMIKNFNACSIESVIIDISPKFCGVLHGICGTVSIMICLFLSLYINHLSVIESTEDLWRSVFLLTGGFCIAINLLFIIFGTAETQPWNFGSRKLIQENIEKDVIH